MVGTAANYTILNIYKEYSWKVNMMNVISFL